MSQHAGKPPPDDALMALMLAIVFGVFVSLYVFLHNWVGLLVSIYQCGQEC